MLGYSSVMHMGYIFLGIASFNIIGVTGAALLMFAHGLSIAALFAIAGQVRERTGTLAFAELGGLAKPDARPRLHVRPRRHSPPSACPASPISPRKSWFSSARSTTAPPGPVLPLPDRHGPRPLGPGHLRRLHAPRLSRRFHGRSPGPLGRLQGHRHPALAADAAARPSAPRRLLPQFSSI